MRHDRRAEGATSWMGVFMALLIGAGAGLLAFGAAWFGLRLFGCPAGVVKGLSGLAGLAVGVLVSLRVFRGRRDRRAWSDSGSGIGALLDGADGIASALGDVLDGVD